MVKAAIRGPARCFPEIVESARYFHGENQRLYSSFPSLSRLVSPAH
jgi:hypothetical protein